MRSRGLSKSKIMAGIQCPKRLYLETYYRELAEESADKEERFAVGHQVGELARTLYPGGTLIDGGDLKDALEETEAALKVANDAVFFEATLQHEDVLFRADILLKEAEHTHLSEVKSSTSVKKEHVQDCAIQFWVLRGAGYPVDSVALVHINNSFVYGGDGDYTGLFAEENITGKVRALAHDVPDWVDRCKQVLAGDLPDVEVGPHCEKPYVCPFLAHCKGEQPAYPVGELPRGGKVVQELLNDGIEDIRDIPEGRLANATQERVRRITVAGKAELNPQAAEALRGLPYPRYYLDFETIGFAIPIWAGTRPYQALPFQWSCHTEDENGELDHAEFLDKTGEPPMRLLAESLLVTLGDSGPIFVYSPFEKHVIKGLAEMFPDLVDKLNALIDRLVDLHPITKAHYYHPAMKGSWSLKALLPTVAPDLDYSTLGEVQEGTAAGRAYLEIIDKKTDPKRRQELIKSLAEYCKLDTLAMVRLARFLQQ